MLIYSKLFRKIVQNYVYVYKKTKELKNYICSFCINFYMKNYLQYETYIINQQKLQLVLLNCIEYINDFVHNLFLIFYGVNYIIKFIKSLQ